MSGGRSLWDHVRGWWVDNARHHVYAPIPKERTDEPYDDAPLEPGGSYLRLWLSEMFLTRRVAWGREWFPAVHSEIRLQFGGQDAAFSKIAQPPLDRLGEGVRLNYRLTELIPFSGGVVEIEAALLGLKGADYLGAAIGVLQQFSGLISPPLGPAIAIAQTLASSTRDLLDATQGNIHLGFHQELISAGAGGAVLRPGYLAVLLAEPDEVSPDRLFVREGRLLYSQGPGQQPRGLQGHDYMLLRVEGRKERDDWRLRDIQDPLSVAGQALLEAPPNTVKADAYRTVALAAAWQSPDLAQLDRRRVVQAIKAELAALADEGAGAVGGEARTLGEIVSARAMRREQADALGELTADEVFDLSLATTRRRGRVAARSAR
jgi:hypothetical protein